jgi:hypothetical protein
LNFFPFVIVTDSPSEVTTQSSPIVPLLSPTCVNEHQHKIIEHAQELQNTTVQLGNRRAIEQLKNKIKVK